MGWCKSYIGIFHRIFAFSFSFLHSNSYRVVECFVDKSNMEVYRLSSTGPRYFSSPTAFCFQHGSVQIIFYRSTLLLFSNGILFPTWKCTDYLLQVHTTSLLQRHFVSNMEVYRLSSTGPRYFSSPTAF